MTKKLWWLESEEWIPRRLSSGLMTTRCMSLGGGGTSTTMYGAQGHRGTAPRAASPRTPTATADACTAIGSVWFRQTSEMKHASPTILLLYVCTCINYNLCKALETAQPSALLTNDLVLRDPTGKGVQLADKVVKRLVSRFGFTMAALVRGILQPSGFFVDWHSQSLDNNHTLDLINLALDTTIKNERDDETLDVCDRQAQGL